MAFVYEEPLKACAIRGHRKALEVLLNAGANVNQTFGSEKDTPLTLAANRGHTQTVQLLAKSGADLTVTVHGFSALMNAVEGDFKPTVEVLISAMKEAGMESSVYDSLVNGAVIRAAKQGHGDILEYLIQSGGDVNYYDEFMGDYPLTLAAPDVQTVTLLLQHGADINRKGCLGRIALHNAAEFKQPNDAIPVLVKAGAKINSLDNSQRTPLMLAAIYGHIENVKHLVKLNAEINWMDYAGMRAIHLAAERNHEQEGDVHGIIKVLIEAGATVNSADHGDTEGITPLMLATKAKYGRGECVKLLIEKGARINATDREGRNALHRAVCPGLKKSEATEPILKMLLHAGGDVRRYSVKHKNVLDTAVSMSYQSKDTVTLVYAAGGTFTNGVKYFTGEYYKNVIDKFIFDDHKPVLDLASLCRRQIRAKMMSPAGGNQSNLVVAVPRLPLPKKLMRYLLFDVNF